ncbi:hypothetical protein A2125_00015 [Candidatus Woesebacteria bacterium GWB1_43_5]|uniref:CAAX prenyl protease 2/Lysostaphin resistance protein A-like domain-containing protein n=1 Tax=Candidatus Woesebacteria bacterium GWB1_43_5 TaxID=1802474 RepID=A0A1F7WUZ4_9BACT|nr:MAG: hypothetical protein A2125_00015 [Candidatus Woesebacteria bacterium GWB1_43_5]
MADILNFKLKYPLLYSLYLIIVWTAYRLSGITVPEAFDEFLVKPVIWLLPVIFLVKRQKNWVKSLGITQANLSPGIYLAVVLGLIFAVEAAGVAYIKRGGLDFSRSIAERRYVYFLFISLGTAVSQELVFRGYLFNRFWGFFKKEIWASLVTSLLWVIIHIPASIALLGYGSRDAVSFLLIVFLYSVGACFIFARTRNIFSTILLFILWEASLVLFG